MRSPAFVRAKGSNAEYFGLETEATSGLSRILDTFWMEAYERTASRRGYRNGFKGKRIQTRVGELHLEIPQVRGLRFYPKVERGSRTE